MDRRQTVDKYPMAYHFSASPKTRGLLISVQNQVSLENGQGYGEVQHDNLMISNDLMMPAVDDKMTTEFLVNPTIGVEEYGTHHISIIFHIAIHCHPLPSSKPPSLTVPIVPIHFHWMLDMTHRG